MRGFLFLEAYARSHAVHLIVLPIAGRGAIPAETAALCWRAECLSPWQYGAWLARFRRQPLDLPSICRYEPDAAARCIAASRQESAPDLLHVQRLALAPAVLPILAQAGRPMAFLDADEDDAATFHSLGDLLQRRGEARAAALSHVDAVRFAALQKRAMPAFDRCFLSTEQEARHLTGEIAGAPCDVIANAPPGIAARPLPAPARDIDLLLVGNYNYFPNRDAAEWMVQSVLPLLPSGLRFLVAGACPADLRRRLERDPRVTVTGRVADLAPLYARAKLALAPLRAGGGSRIKILEAAAHGLPVVSTALGAAGLPFRATEHLWIADDAESFAACCREALDHPAIAAAKAENAGRLLQAEASREAVLNRIEAFARAALAAR